VTQGSPAPSKPGTPAPVPAIDKPAIAKSERAKKSDNEPRRPWRDNIEAVTMAIVMAVMLKYFIVEAYKIPTGSMQPTLMGNEETGIYDRIIVDKASYHFRDPERFEVVVFKYPLDRSKNFIKRLCGMPGEWLKVESGDLWTRKGDNDEWKILRRPAPVQREVWKRIDPEDARFASWKTDSARWTSRKRAGVEARGDGSARIPNDGGSVVDNYRDGYPGRLGSLLVRRHPGGHAVGDVRVVGDVKALAGCKLVTIELREGSRRYKFELPGPAASDDATPAIRTEGVPTSREWNQPSTLAAPQHRKLQAGKSIRFAAQNMDDMLELDLDGDKLLELEIPSAADQASSITLRQDGEGADFSDLETYRDIYYTSETKVTQFKIPEQSYVMLGDNTQDSSDSREWQLGKYKVGDTLIRGNWRPLDQNTANPAQVPGDPEGTRIFFRDEWGELHTFFPKPGSGPEFDPAPFVPRNLIVGRAVIVFWPLWPFVPDFDMSRIKWVR
jgi:signal peptidase I